MKLAGNLEGGCDSICSFCSRMKRGRIYKCARANGYNVMALGQHLDDLAERYVTHNPPTTPAGYFLFIYYFFGRLYHFNSEMLPK